MMHLSVSIIVEGPDGSLFEVDAVQPDVVARDPGALLAVLRPLVNDAYRQAQGQVVDHTFPIEDPGTETVPEHDPEVCDYVPDVPLPEYEIEAAEASAEWDEPSVTPVEVDPDGTVTDEAAKGDEA